MVAKRARTPDVAPWEQNVRKRLTFRRAEDNRGFEGLVTGFETHGLDSQPTVSVIHTDGLVRRWKVNEIEVINVLSDNPFTENEINAKLSGRVGKGGTVTGKELVKKGQLQGKTVHVWDENERSWLMGEVLQAFADGKHQVSFTPGEATQLDLGNMVWKLDGELSAEILKAQDDELILEDTSVPVVVSEQRHTKQMHIYLQTRHCSASRVPKVHATARAIHIQDSSEDEQMSRDIVVVLEKHRQCDTSEVVDAVLDKDMWLKVTFRTVS